MRIELTGRIDSKNAAQIEEEVMAKLSADSDPDVVLDAEGLEYISSAGLRILLRVRRERPQMRIVNVSPNIYSILETTSFTQVLSVERAPGYEEESASTSGAFITKPLRTDPGMGCGAEECTQEKAASWAEFMLDYLPEEAGQKLLALLRAVPCEGCAQASGAPQGKVPPVDMDTLSVGHPIFVLASIYDAFVGSYELDPEGIKLFHGFDCEAGAAFWHQALSSYLDTSCPQKILEVEDKVRIIGYTRLIRRAVRCGAPEDEKLKTEIEHWKKELVELLEKTDTLLFDRDDLFLPATDENLEEVQAFVDEHLARTHCPLRTKLQLAIAVEELFINIAHYAYAPNKGMAKVRVVLGQNPSSITITFFDRGTPYDPLAREDPDVTLSAEERRIGGLGIYMVKQSMDDVRYEFRDGQNILSIMKKL